METFFVHEKPPARALPVRGAKRRTLTVLFADIFAALVCGVVIAVTLVLALWASLHGKPELLAAVGSTSGLVFFALAVDSRRRVALLQLATGLALMLLGWAIFSLSTGFVIVSGLLVAAWLAAFSVKVLRAKRSE